MELISEHITYHVAVEAAVNAVLPCGESINIVQSPKFSVYDDGSIKNVGFKATFTKKACNNFSINVSWSAPTNRERGEILNPDEIAGYELDVQGTIYGIAPELTEYRLNGLTRGLKVLRIRTIDQDGVESIWSDEITVTLE